MTLGELGEFGFIDRLREWTTIDVDDDAAVLELDGRQLVVSSDALVDGNHFRRDWSSPADIGWKSVSVNVSDIAAMGCRPRWLTMTLCAPPATTEHFLEGLYAGVREACEAYGCVLVGGDTIRGDELTLSVTAIGTPDEATPVLRRSGARIGDVVAVTGPLGRAACGVNLLLSQDPKGVSPDDALACMDAHRRPVARVGVGPRGAHAAIDVSDGLASDVRHLAHASGVGVAIDALPVAPEVQRIAAARGWDAEQIALAGGEDFELLFALPEEHVGDLIPIGRVVESGITYKGESLDVTGFDHFSKR